MQRPRSLSGYRIEVLAEQHHDWFAADLRTLLKLLDAHAIEPLLEGSYPLEEAAVAHSQLGERALTGKLVLTMDA